MKARIEVRHFVMYVALHAMYDTVHHALINRYTRIVHVRMRIVQYSFSLPETGPLALVNAKSEAFLGAIV